jgi:hypothetical protein
MPKEPWSLQGIPRLYASTSNLCYPLLLHGAGAQPNTKHWKLLFFIWRVYVSAPIPNLHRCFRSSLSTNCLSPPHGEFARTIKRGTRSVSSFTCCWPGKCFLLLWVIVKKLRTKRVTGSLSRFTCCWSGGCLVLSNCESNYGLSREGGQWQSISAGGSNLDRHVDAFWLGNNVLEWNMVLKWLFVCRDVGDVVAV